MADKKISQLTDGTSFQSGDEAVVNRGGVNYKVDPTQFSELTVDAGGTLRLNASSTTDFFTIIQGGTQAVLTADSPDGAANMVFRTTAAGVDLDRMEIASNGDISFYEDTGTTPKFFWDASAERLGLGTTSPATNLDISQFGGTPTIRISNSDGTFDAGQDIGKLEFYCGDQSTPGERVASYILSQAAGTQGGGDLQFATSANAGTVTERMRIDSAGNVGIGTNSPQTVTNYTVLEIGADNIGSMIVLDGTTTGQYHRVYNNDTLLVIDADPGDVGASTAITFKTDGSEAMRIDSSGNVGIGFSSPAEKLEVAGNILLNASNAEINLKSGVTGTIGAINWTFNTDSTDFTSIKLPYDDRNTTGLHIDSGYPITIDAAGIGTIFAQSGSEKARIDSSGNLLVGTTDTNPANDPTGTGVAVGNEGWVAAARDGDTSGMFNRLTSDGDIVTFHKDGTTVGSIGAKNNDIYIGTGDTGLRFVDSSQAIWVVDPTTGSARNGAVDLGSSSVGFKDLYLGGGVYLGGTGAANLLDDYETGTFTPAFSASTTSDFTHASASGSYTKIGRLVYVNVVLNLSAVGTSAGRIRVSNLPFTIADVLVGTGVESAPIINFWGGVTNAIYGLQGVAQQSTTYVELTKITGAQTDLSNDLNVADIDADFSIRMTMVYQAA